MIKLRAIQLLFFGSILLALAGCESKEEVETDAPSVFLSVTRAAHTDGNESINTDATDYEDRVHDMAMLVFDTSTGKKVSEYYDRNIAFDAKYNTFVVEMTPGTRNFYFVANMPLDGLKTITTEGEMKTYMDQVRNLDADLYLAATKDKGFPMSRVYLNQVVAKGGTVSAPLPFRPDGEDKVKLIRTAAKLEVILDGTNLNVTKLSYHNANREFRLSANGTVPSTFYNDLTGTELTLKGNTYMGYMPEAIIEGAKWETTPYKPINYFVIEMGGKRYEIPIISNETSITDNYVRKAKGEVAGFTPEYTIWRNHHYKYRIRYTAEEPEFIEVFYVVEDWNVIKKSMYMGYGYTVEVDEDGSLTLTNTVDDCLPHQVKLTALNGAYFGTDSTKKEWVYGFTDSTNAGYDPAKLKAGYVETSNVNTDAVAAGTAYLEISYNGTPVKTFIK